MTMGSSISVLASFATLKGLSDAKKYSNAYQILAEFIDYIIKTEKLYVFSSIEMKNRLKSQFGFTIPEAVIRATLKKIAYITLSNGIYTADIETMICDDSFEKIKNTTESENFGIMQLLSAYIKESTPGKEIIHEDLERDFIAFLVDDQEKGPGCYTTQIGEFILKNEDNVNIQSSLRAIKEGSILYIGLNYNMNETGSLTKELTLFLGTEVLFGLAGYNGEIHKQLALDLFSLIQSSNLNSKKIKLRFFPEVKREIDGFFSSAESIVDGKLTAFDTAAMSAIINNCDTSSDVLVKQSDFYHMMQYTYGIIEDDKDDYYAERYDVYNLESDMYTDPQQQNSWAFISHINKLRKGVVYLNDTDAEYLVVTNTRSTLNASKEQTEINKSAQGLEYANDYAVSINRMTNILWYKLGNGFGNKKYPNNVDAVLKARVILASNVSHNVSEIYNQAKKQYKSGDITKEQLAARIITLRKKPIMPEELEGDSIEDIMDFSPDYISRFEEEVSSNKSALQEKELLIKQMEEQNQHLLINKEETIAQKERVIQEKDADRNSLVKELEEFREKEAIKTRQRKKVKHVFQFTLSVAWKLVLMAVLVCISVFFEKKLNSNIPMYICAAVDLIGLILTGWVAVKKDFTKYFLKEPQKSNSEQPKTVDRPL